MTNINIHPVIKGQVTPIDLIQAVGAFKAWFDSAQFGVNKGFLFRVVSSNYHLEVGFTQASFYIKRNQQVLEIPLERCKQTGYAMCFAQWQPDKVKLTVLDKTFGEAIDSGADRDAEVENRTVTLETLPVLPPNSLILWARTNAIAPVIKYHSPSDFYQEVTYGLQMLQDKIESSSMYNAFWDITYEGSKVVSRKPKRETDIASTIHGLLFDIGAAKNFMVSPEHPVGRGKLDFLISGCLESASFVNVCVEFKHAHSNYLKRGLLNQLPYYMQLIGAEFGIYYFLFFKGAYFNSPKMDLKELHFALTQLATSSGLFNVRVLGVDLSGPKPPSAGC